MKKLFLLITILSLLVIAPIVSAAVDYTENFDSKMDVLMDQDFQDQAEYRENARRPGHTYLHNSCTWGAGASRVYPWTGPLRWLDPHPYGA